MGRDTEKKGVKSRIVSAAWQLFYEKGYNGTTVDDIIELSATSKDELLDTLAMILDDYYEELEVKMDPEMNSFSKLLYLNYEMHKMMEEKINIDLLASLYSTQLVSERPSHLLDQNRNYYRLLNQVVEEGQMRGQIRQDVPASEVTRYYAMCERALVSDWCLNKGKYSLGQYSRECMPYMLEHFKM